jgi:hypothetical protein
MRPLFSGLRRRHKEVFRTHVNAGLARSIENSPLLLGRNKAPILPSLNGGRMPVPQCSGQGSRATKFINNHCRRCHAVNLYAFFVNVNRKCVLTARHQFGILGR